MDPLDRGVTLTARVFGWLFVLAGIFLASVFAFHPRTDLENAPLLIVGMLLATIGFPFTGLGGVIATWWRKLFIGRLLRSLVRALGGTVEVSPDATSIRWTGEHEGMNAALFWILDGPSTQVAIQVPGGSPGAFRIIPTWLRGGKLMGGRTRPLGHEEFDRNFIARSEPDTLIGELFSGTRRDRIAGEILGVPGGSRVRVILTLSDLRIRIPRVLRRAPELHAVLRAAHVLVDALLETAKAAGYAVVTVGVGSGARCPICISPLEAEVVLCLKCRTPHHEGCWQYTGECATFACGGRRWIRTGPDATPFARDV